MRNMCKLGVSLTLVALIVGCNKPDASGTKRSGAVAAKGHSHGKGPHGGAVGDWGGGKFHIEFTVSHPDKQARVYILGSDETTPAPIAARDGKLILRIKGVKTKDEFDVELKADPQKGDPEGKASAFVGMNDKLGIEQEFEGTVSGEAGGIPYTGNFKEEPEVKK